MWLCCGSKVTTDCIVQHFDDPSYKYFEKKNNGSILLEKHIFEKKVVSGDYSDGETSCDPSTAESSNAAGDSTDSFDDHKDSLRLTKERLRAIEKNDKSLFVKNEGAFDQAKKENVSVPDKTGEPLIDATHKESKKYRVEEVVSIEKSMNYVIIKGLMDRRDQFQMKPGDDGAVSDDSTLDTTCDDDDSTETLMGETSECDGSVQSEEGILLDINLKSVSSKEKVGSLEDYRKTGNSTEGPNFLAPSDTESRNVVSGSKSEIDIRHISFKQARATFEDNMSVSVPKTSQPQKNEESPETKECLDQKDQSRNQRLNENPDPRLEGISTVSDNFPKELEKMECLTPNLNEATKGAMVPQNFLGTSSKGSLEKLVLRGEFKTGTIPNIQDLDKLTRWILAQQKLRALSMEVASLDDHDDESSSQFDNTVEGNLVESIQQQQVIFQEFALKILVVLPPLLRELDLRMPENHVDSVFATEFADRLGRTFGDVGCALLIKITISVAMSPDGAGKVALALGRCPLLEYLCLRCELGDDGVRAFAKICLRNNKKLKVLNLSQNKIGDDGARSIAENLKDNASLTKLDLSSNQIRNGGIAALTECLKSNQMLSILDLDDNMIGRKAIHSVSGALRENQSLTELHIHGAAYDLAGMMTLRDTVHTWNHTILRIKMDAYSSFFDMKYKDGMLMKKVEQDLMERLRLNRMWSILGHPRHSLWSPLAHPSVFNSPSCIFLFLRSMPDKTENKHHKPTPDGVKHTGQPKSPGAGAQRPFVPVVSPTKPALLPPPLCGEPISPSVEKPKMTDSALPESKTISSLPSQRQSSEKDKKSNPAMHRQRCGMPYAARFHKDRKPCDRCLDILSNKERAKFESTGHHPCVMFTHGGCGRDCCAFPRQKSECPVRLCRRCFFDTHKAGPSGGDCFRGPHRLILKSGVLIIKTS